MGAWEIVLLALVSYLIGTFPSGYLAGRLARVDVRQHGSGNVGATNVLRVLGKPFGYAVFLADAVKGILAVRLALYVAAHAHVPVHLRELVAILCAVTCVIGHTFPVWFKFNGGKGVATSAGVILGLMPLAMLTIFLIWVIVFEITRYVSMASIIAAIALPIAVAIFIRSKIETEMALLYFSIVMALLVIWRHRSNFARLRDGTEQRFDRK